MDKSSKRSLFLAANLSLPTFQVITIGADLGCAHCLQRVTQVITRMSGSRDFAVNVSRKQVVITGGTKFIKREVARDADAGEKKIENPSVFGCLYKFLIWCGAGFCSDHLFAAGNEREETSIKNWRKRLVWPIETRNIMWRSNIFSTIAPFSDLANYANNARKFDLKLLNSCKYHTFVD